MSAVISPLAVQDARYAVSRHIDLASQFGRGDPKLLDGFGEMLARMD